MVISKVSCAEALQALQKIRLFEEQHESGDNEWILRFYRHERVMRAREFQGSKQASIKACFEWGAGGWGAGGGLFVGVLVGVGSGCCWLRC